MGVATTPRPRPSPTDTLEQAWGRRPGIVGWLTAVNHKDIGLRFIFTGLAFLLLGGLLAVLMRTQLISPESEFLSADAFNAAFTMHGATMMFLFAVPILEGLGMYLLPLMLGTRDLPFPRLNAFGYWCYLLGGLLFYSSIVVGEPPRDGWFAYVPLSGPEFSRGGGMDFWLLGLTFVEIAGITGAIELIVGFFTRRAPGMALNRVPVFAWSVVAMAAMMAIAFPTLVAASVLLELDRLVGTHVFNPAAGGDVLLWQHLFWFFGHPEVYIMLLPATGIISMVVPAFARRPLAGYSFVVAALLATALISFGLWVHHMFTTGLSLLGMSFFAAAGLAIVIPSGVQVFAWLRTLWTGRPALQTPLLFVLGFVFIFLLGGITGVMVSAVPFNWQVHDSYFVVAHFHYVLIGGVLFPIFGGLYYWFPKWTGRLVSEPLGKTSFWTMFVGFNVAFLPQHLLGFEGMPRRVYTYRESDGWTTENLISTLGSYLLAGGVLLTMAALLIAWRRGRPAGDDPWGAGSLEWATSSPPPPYNFAVPPVVDSAYPLWREGGTRDVPRETAALVTQMADPPPSVREVIETTAVDARPTGVARVPGPSLWPLLTATSIAVALIGLIASSTATAVVGAALAITCLIAWVATAAREAPAPVAGRVVPIRSSGAGAWGMALGGVQMLVILGAIVYAIGELATEDYPWPPAGVPDPPIALGLVACAAALACAGVAHLALRAARESRLRTATRLLAAGAATALVLAGAAVLWVDGFGVAATDHAYGSIVWITALLLALYAAALAVVLAVAAWQAGRGGIEPGHDVSLHVARALALTVLLSSIVVLAALWLVPRL